MIRFFNDRDGMMTLRSGKKVRHLGNPWCFSERSNDVIPSRADDEGISTMFTAPMKCSAPAQWANWPA